MKRKQVNNFIIIIITIASVPLTIKYIPLITILIRNRKLFIIIIIYLLEYIEEDRL